MENPCRLRINIESRHITLMIKITVMDADQIKRDIDRKAMLITKE